MIPKWNKDRVKKCLNIASEIAGILVLIKGKPTVLDLFAISTKTLDISARIHSEISSSRMMNPWDFFKAEEENSPWLQLPSAFENYIVPEAKEINSLVGFTDPLNPNAFLAKVYGFDCGWIQHNKGQKNFTFFIKKTDYLSFLEKMNESFWKTTPGKHLLLNKGEMISDQIDISELVETNFIEEVRDYVSGILNAGEHGSCLLIGDPGTGKTLAIQYVIQQLGLRSVRIPLKTLARSYTWENSFDFKTSINITMPDVLIIDDIDRLDSGIQKELLDFIDTSKNKIKFFIASANNLYDMIAPLRRPGRFDEHFQVPELSNEVLQKLLSKKGIRKEMQKWPISYVEYYNKHVRIFGESKDNEIIKKLQLRVENNRDKDKEED